MKHSFTLTLKIHLDLAWDAKIHKRCHVKIREKASRLFCKLQANSCVFILEILQESQNFSLPLQHVEDIDMGESGESCTSAFLTLPDRSWTEPNPPNYIT